MAWKIFLSLCLFLPLILTNKQTLQAAETIKVGVIFAKTGKAAQDGLYNFQAIRFAAKEINAKGGILRRKIQLIEFDNHGTPVYSKIMARKAIKENVVAVIGSAWSTLSLAVARVLQPAGIPMISPASTNPKVTKIGSYIFRVCFTDTYQAKVLALFTRQELNARTAIIFTDITSDYSLGFSKIFVEQFRNSGGKIILEQEYKHGQESFQSLLLPVKRLSPDILVMTGHAESGQIVKQAQEMGIDVVMVGGDGWEARGFLVEGGLELKRGYFTTHWSDKLKTKKSQDFVVRYRQYNELNALSALAYDAMKLLAAAITKAGSTDRKAIRNALAKTKNFEGVTGSISFDKNGDPIKSIVIKQIRNGQISYLKTIDPITLKL